MKTVSAIAAALVVLALPAMAHAAQRHAKRATVVASSDPHTACTEFGCGPVPFGCGKRPGNPAATGPARYDEIVCPPFSPGLRPR
jgi:hypothetical protein